MSQEKNNEDFDANENAFDSPEENLNTGEAIEDASRQEDSQEIDNLPIESIGSYARLEELLTDEEKENTTNPTAQS